jgi:1-aminocyclopropane-1-carboxylate deaminase
MPSEILPFFESSSPKSILQLMDDELFEFKKVKVYIKRDDLLHAEISGNKWRKLKYNLIEAERQGKTQLLTFGGAFSNHLAAVAAAGATFGFGTVGIIRGEELHPASNKTLKKAAQDGMKMIFVSREAYRDKEQLAKTYSQNHFVIPEGGNNEWAVAGTAEILPEIVVQLGQQPDYVCVAAGTGATAAGIAKSVAGGVQLLVFPALKIPAESVLNQPFYPLQFHSKIMADYHFGGYAKYDKILLDFMQYFEQKQTLLIEQVYTAKMLFGLYDLIQKNYFRPHSTIVAIHTGGLQGRLLMR